jgi:DNA-binding SARP family transcriptional activator/Tfp pilus assembly protein PilF
VIRLRTLGALDLRGPGGEELRAVLAQPRRAALLAYLALATPRGAHRRDTVLALFWPELDVDRARNALGQAVHFLRRSIGAGAVVNRNGDGLAVDWSTFWCDAAAFEEALDANRVGEALALYRGDLLEGFHIGDAPDFERWLESERARLAARYTKAVETVASEREEAGDFHGAVTHWRVLTARDPYSSRLTLRLMRALIAAGDPATALAQARQHERLLREELEIAPDAEVAALVRQLQSEQAEQSPSGTSSRAAQSANDRVRVADQPAAQKSPFDAARPRRRTATLTIGLLAVCVVAGAAVLKSGSGDVRAIPAPVATQTTGAGDGVPKEVYLRDLYVRGRNAEKSRSEVGLATAREAYEGAIARDSTFALGYAGLATVYGLLGQYGFMPLGTALDSARVMARRAVTLDSTLSETRTAVAVTLANARKFDAAEAEFKRAIDLDSSDALAHFGYSALLVTLGRGEDAQREARRAAELDPVVSRAVVAMQRYATWLITGKRPYLQLPVRERRPFLKLEPGDPWSIARQAEDLAQAGECAEARSDLERAQRLAPDNVRMRPFMARVDWRCGERPRARDLLDDMKRRPDARDNAFNVALMHTLFGEKDSAFVWLEYQHRWGIGELTMLSASPYLDPLRSDPRYLRLLRRLGMRK